MSELTSKFLDSNSESSCSITKELMPKILSIHLKTEDPGIENEINNFMYFPPDQSTKSNKFPASSYSK